MNDYPVLVEKLRQIAHLESIRELLGWDEQVNLPSGSADKRAEELSALATVIHARQSDPDLGALIATCEGNATLNEAQRCVVNEAKRRYERAVRLPATLVAERALSASRAYHAWKEARAASDFAAYAPFLDEQIRLCKAEASCLGFAQNPYDYWIDRHDPGLTARKVAELFAELKRELVPLSDRILTIAKRPAPLIGFPVKEQEAFVREVTAAIGFDYKRGRLDVAVHPFCGGSGQDTRMTTRYDVDNPMDALFSAIHETGHALYEQGLPTEHFGTALGEAVGMAIHESQSRLWENQVGRSHAFWSYFEPKFRAHFPKQTQSLSSDALFGIIGSVSRNPIRVDSDEVTYNLHILLRFELERALFSGSLSVEELPHVWNRLSHELLGLVPQNDAQGVLQDVHWSGGAFGYFPSYCMGNMLAAQLWYTAKDAMPSLETDFKRGDFSRLLTWLRKHVHAHGKRFDTLALARNATGSELSPQALLRYLKERYC